MSQCFRRLDRDLTPALRRLPEIAADVQKTMANTNRLVVSLDNGYGDNTKFSRDLDRLLLQTNDALRSIRSLVDLLTRQPEALIGGRPARGLE